MKTCYQSTNVLLITFYEVVKVHKSLLRSKSTYILGKLYILLCITGGPGVPVFEMAKHFLKTLN